MTNLIILLHLTGTIQAPNTQKCILPIQILGANIQAGSPLSGTEDAPDGLRNLGLIEILRKQGLVIHDNGDVNEANESNLSHNWIFGYHRLKSPLIKIKNFVERTVKARELPVIIGGDHSISIATISGAQAAKEIKLGVIILDAHEDSYAGSPRYLHSTFLDDITSPRGGAFPEVHRAIDPKRITVLGSRNWNASQMYRYRRMTIDEIRRLGPTKTVERIVEGFGKYADVFHVSFDVDVLDPRIATGFNYPRSGGLEAEEASALLSEIAKSGKVISMDFVEYVPSLDNDGITGRLLVQLIVSALQKLK